MEGKLLTTISLISRFYSKKYPLRVSCCSQFDLAGQLETQIIHHIAKFGTYVCKLAQFWPIVLEFLHLLLLPWNIKTEGKEMFSMCRSAKHIARWGFYLMTWEGQDDRQWCTSRSWDLMALCNQSAALRECTNLFVGFSCCKSKLIQTGHGKWWVGQQ